MIIYLHAALTAIITKITITKKKNVIPTFCRIFSIFFIINHLLFFYQLYYVRKNYFSVKFFWAKKKKIVILTFYCILFVKIHIIWPPFFIFKYIMSEKIYFKWIFLNHKHSCSVRNINNLIIYFYVLLVTVKYSEKEPHFETHFPIYT